MLRWARGWRGSRSKHLLATQGRGACFGVLLIAIFVVEAPKLASSFGFLSDGRDWIVTRAIITSVLMVAVPFLLARMAPRAASFDMQWLPPSRSHWAWFLGMLFILLAGGAVGTWVARLRPPDPWPYQDLLGNAVYLGYKPATFVVAGLLDVLVVPIAR